MKRQKKTDSGITLVALVVSIIVMLVLAGVSLNATIGENGIVTRAQEAAEMSKKTSIIEQIQEHLMKYNIDLLSGDKKTAAKTAIDNLINDDVVDNCMAADGSFTTDTTKLAAIPLVLDDGSWTGEFEYVVGKEEYAFNIYQDKDGIFKVEISDIIAGAGALGGEVTGGKTLVTSETFTSGDNGTTDVNEKGKYTIVGDASVIFANELSGSYSIYVKSGANATVSIFYSMSLSNANLKRSAIDIEPGATLNLWIADGAVVTVDSGAGNHTATAVDWNYLESEGILGGNGGFAGIHVPKYDTDTTINLVLTDDEGHVIRDRDGNAVYNTKHFQAGVAKLSVGGKGTLEAYGGDAGDGGNGGHNNLDSGGGGGGGAGAGIGGNGGNGGSGFRAGGRAGQSGENCGIVNFGNEIIVNAYGGKGGSGGGNEGHSGSQGSGSWGTSGGGGGGFPAAGIGGGGAGGTSGDTASVGSGFSTGTSENTTRYTSLGGTNGRVDTVAASPWSTNDGFSRTFGGAYYESYANHSYIDQYREKLYNYSGYDPGTSGGIGGGCCSTSTQQANVLIEDCAQAGKGGTITVSEKATINAYNGSYITLGSYNKQSDQALIYAQAGYDVKAVRELMKVKVVNARTISALVAEWSTTDYNFSAQRTILSPYDSTCGDLAGTYVLGIGSGAGGSQTADGNGTYTISSNLN